MRIPIRGIPGGVDLEQVAQEPPPAPNEVWLHNSQLGVGQMPGQNGVPLRFLRVVTPAWPGVAVVIPMDPITAVSIGRALQGGGSS